MDNILNKFNKVVIKNENRIDAEDKNYCETFEKIYQDTLKCYKNTLDSLILLYNQQIVTVKNSYDLDVSYYGRDFSISNVIESIINLKRNFINKLCHYFSRKYNVTINEEIIYEKYEDKEIDFHKRENTDKTLKLNLIEYIYLDYNIVLDEIFLQLGGLSFYEKAISEIKEKAKLPLHYYEWGKCWNYEVKGRIIKFKVGIRDIYPSLYYYDSNETQIIDCFSFNKIDDFKSYENGNTDIKFLNSEYALEFATKYLGYVIMTEEERELFKKKCS